MKYELYIQVAQGHWLYFATDKDTVSEAFEEFQYLCNRIGINDDNANYVEAKLYYKDTGYDVEGQKLEF